MLLHGGKKQRCCDVILCAQPHRRPHQHRSPRGKRTSFFLLLPLAAFRFILLLQVPLPKPQETLMWEEFARCVVAIKDRGEKPNPKWMQLARDTQQVVLAVDASLKRGGAPIRVVDLSVHLQ